MALVVLSSLVMASAPTRPVHGVCESESCDGWYARMGPSSQRKSVSALSCLLTTTLHAAQVQPQGHFGALRMVLMLPVYVLLQSVSSTSTAAAAAVGTGTITTTATTSTTLITASLAAATSTTLVAASSAATAAATTVSQHAATV